MNDLISRQDAIDAIREMSPELFSAYQHNVYIDRQGALVRLIALPSAQQYPTEDVAPVVHGEWIDVNGDGSLLECGNCHERSCCKGNYCSNCGARMDGGK